MLLALLLLLSPPWTSTSAGPFHSYVWLQADVTNSTVTPADVAGLLLPVQSNTDYRVQCTIGYTAAATTTGVLLTWTGPANPNFAAGLVLSATTTTAANATLLTGNDTGTVSTATPATSAVNVAFLTGIWRNGANAGNLQLRFRSEVAASAIVVKAGSYCMWGNE